MNGEGIKPLIGHIVQVTQGREKGQYAIIINIIDDRYVLLADGNKRKYDRPKKKNINHISLTSHISDEVRNSLLETHRVSNGKLRFAISKFEKEIVTDIGKGDNDDV